MLGIIQSISTYIQDNLYRYTFTTLYLTGRLNCYTSTGNATRVDNEWVNFFFGDLCQWTNHQDYPL